MNCPDCNEPITVFNIEQSLYKSKVYCEHCKKFQEFPLTIRDIKKCQCGLTFKHIYEKKLLGCEYCYQTFKNELKVFFEYHNLDEIYLLEKVSYRDIAIKKDSISYERLKVFLESYHIFLNSSDISYLNANLLKKINLLNNQKNDFHISIRLRYTRNLPSILYHLENKNIYFISKILLDKNFIFKKILNQHQIKEDKHYNYDNVLFYSYFLNSRELLLRLYVGDEDHFRIDIIDFMNLYNDDIIMDQVNNILNIYELFQNFDLLLPWQFKSDLGFLTKCPTNTGSGIRLYIKIKIYKENHLKFLHFFQRNPFFLRLKNYVIRGDNGEGSEIKNYITIGWDLPYIDIKKFKIDLEKKLIIWLNEVQSNIKNKLK